MKNLKYLFSLLCLTLIIFACKEDYGRCPECPVTSTAPVLNIGQSSVNLPPNVGTGTDDFLIRINWSQPRFTFKSGLPAEVTQVEYTVEMDIVDNLFANPVIIATTENLYTDIYSNQLNNWVTDLLGVETLGSNQLVEIRVAVTYKEDGVVADPLYSNMVTLMVIPYIEPVEPPEAKDVMIQWKQVEGDWEDFAIYAWGAAEVFGGWPGKHIQPDADGWYSVVVPKDRPINLILNNNGGGKQLDFLTDPTESGSYEINTTLGTFEKVDNPAKEITIQWKYVGSDWTEFGIYAWGASPDGETFGGWPGTVVTPDAEGWCNVTVPAGQTVGNVIFNNAGAGGQFDVNLEIISGVCFEITSDSYTVVDRNAAPPEPVDDVMIQWKQTEGNWTDFAIYAWGAAEVFGGWPGKQIQSDADGWYSVVIPKSRPVNLILNNNGGGSQLNFLTDPTESGSYEINTTDGTFEKVDNPAKEITIRWKYVGSDWTEFGIYAWGGSPVGDTFGSWPGTVVTPDADGWCSVTVPAGQTVGNVIFNNTTGGAGNQFDVKLNIISGVCFEITSDSYTVVDYQ